MKLLAQIKLFSKSYKQEGRAMQKDVKSLER